MTRQEIKDALWRLDEDCERLTAQITELTGRAWKAAVEPGTYGDFRKELIHARVATSILHDRLYRAEGEFYLDEDESHD